MKPKPHGRQRILGNLGQPLPAERAPEDDEEPPPEAAEPKGGYWEAASRQISPRPWRSKVPLSHGRLSEEEALRLDAIGKKRRSGGYGP